MALPWDALDPAKLIIPIIFDSVCEAIGKILTNIVSISHFGKRPVEWDMIIFGSHVGLHVSKHMNSY